MRKVMRGVMVAAIASLFLTAPATAAFATVVPPGGSGAPDPPLVPFDKLIQVKGTGSSGYAYIYVHWGEVTGYTAYISSCDTAADGHHSWTELEQKYSGGSWVTHKPNNVNDASAQDLSGMGTCSDSTYYYTNTTTSQFQLRLVTYAMEGNTVEHGPSYSSVYMPY